MREIDFAAHNAQVRQVWDAYRARRPLRVPLVFGINTRYTLLDEQANARGIGFERYFHDAQTMLEGNLQHKEWIRFHVPQDAEMGAPADGWDVHVDFQNVYEAAWFGCKLRFNEGQVPDSEPLLQDDKNKRLLFERGQPDPFSTGLMARNWEFYDYFVEQQKRGFEWLDKPLKSVTPSGLGTDGPLTVACNVRGAGEFLTDLAEDPDYALELLDFITTATINRIRAYRQRLGHPLKTPSWGFADDSLQLISTSFYREFIFPFHQRLVDAFSEGGPNGIHLCGDSTRHFAFLRDNLNIQSFDTGFPVDFTALRESVGRDVEILGGPAVPFLAQATPGEVMAETQRILESGICSGGRFVLREGNNLAPGTPLENLWAMWDAVHAFGSYDRSAA